MNWVPIIVSELRVAVDQALEQPVLRATLPHVELVVAKENVTVDHTAAFGQMLRVSSYNT